MRTLRKSIDGLVMIVQNQLKLDPFDKALFVFCNKKMDKLKILHFDEGFWLYYHRLERSHFKWPSTPEEALNSKDIEINNLKNELAYLKGIIANRNKKLFGVSSEKIDTNQLSFFNEAEKHTDSKVKEPTLEEITYKRAKKNSVTGKKYDGSFAIETNSM